MTKCTNNMTECYYTNTPSIISNRKTTKITFDSSAHTFYVSSKLLVDNFGYFKKKNDLNSFDENKSCINISYVTEDIFETLLNVISNGKF